MIKLSTAQISIPFRQLFKTTKILGFIKEVCYNMAYEKRHFYQNYHQKNLLTCFFL